MCGIAGIVCLDGGPSPHLRTVRAMTDAILHRGPDEDGYYEAPGMAFGMRRLSIVGLEDGQQPVANEDGQVNAVFNGELFDYPETKHALLERGHILKTGCDTELIPHLWEEQAGAMFAELRGQFAIAIHDRRQHRVVLARDRFGICPLYWTVQRAEGRAFLLFASEIKALLASGMVEPRPDLRGLDHAFTFFALPGPVTCFEGIRMLKPGHFLQVRIRKGEAASVDEKPYWEIDFPDAGEEKPGDAATVEQYRALFQNAVKRRLRADVPVVSYLSGGVDSAWVLATAAQIRGSAPDSFTLQIRVPGLDELPRAAEIARTIGSRSHVVPIGIAEILATYPRLIRAAECPVSDTVSNALLLLAQAVHREGYKVALTGEGSDEMLAGYPWFKFARLIRPVDMAGFGAGNAARRVLARALGVPANQRSYDRRVYDALGGANAWLDVYGWVGAGKHRAYGDRLRPMLNSYVPYEDLELNRARMKRWHPFNRSLHLGQRIHLPGLLLGIAGDRVAMHSSVETRYPFLDEDLCDFTQRLAPSWKLRRYREKYLLRRAAEQDLPKATAWRPKQMLRATWDVFGDNEAESPFAALLTPQAISATGYFDPAVVQDMLARSSAGSAPFTLSQNLVSIATTQLWHHLFIEDLGAPAERYRPPALA